MVRFRSEENTAPTNVAVSIHINFRKKRGMTAQSNTRNVQLSANIYRKTEDTNARYQNAD